MCLQCKSFENTVGKGEIARYEQFLLFPQCFLLFWRTFHHFRQILNCCLQTLLVWKRLKFVFWERVKKFHFIAMATRDFDDIKFCEYFLKRTSQKTFLPSLVQIGPVVWEEMFNWFPNDKVFELFKLKAFADNKINVDEK